MFKRKEKGPKKSEKTCTNGNDGKPVEQLTKDELNHLQETKSRLFGGVLSRTDNKKQVVSIVHSDHESTKATVAFDQHAQNEDASLPSSTSHNAPPTATRNKPRPPPPPAPPRPSRNRQNNAQDAPPDYAPPVPPSPTAHAPLSLNLSGKHTSNGSSEQTPCSTPVSICSNDTNHDELLENEEYHPLKTFSLAGVELPALRPVQMIERIVTLQRAANGSFGVSLRRANLSEQREEHGAQEHSARAVVFAEPQQTLQGMPTALQLQSSLLPGDMLLCVNGHNVEHVHRDQVAALISQSGPALQLTVRTVPELCELTAIRTDALNELSDLKESSLTLHATQTHHKHTANQGDMTDTSSNAATEPDSAVWLMHQKGYVGAQLLSGQDKYSNKVTIRIDQHNDTMQVDADDIEQANPPELDRVDNVCSLVYLNESSVLHLLRQRHGCHLSYTQAGTQCTVHMNAHALLHSHNTHTDKLMLMFKGGQRHNLPPHIYSVAEQLYRQTQCTGAAQACVFTGRSGSGKSTQCKHLLQYLCATAGSTNKHITPEKLSAVFTTLRAFGCCSIPGSNQASRFVSLFTMHFDHLGQCSAASLQALLFECTRVVRRAAGQSNFHVLHELNATDNGPLRQSLKLSSCEHEHLAGLLGEQVSPADSTAQAMLLDKLLSALTTLGLTAHELEVVCNSLAAVLHLASAHATTGVAAARSQFVRVSNAQTAAELLGVSYEDLHKAVFQTHAQTQPDHEPAKKNSPATSTNSSHRRVPMKAAAFTFRMTLDAKSSITDKVGDGLDALHAFIVGLYNQIFNLVVTYINRSLASNYRTVSSITLVDCPGWQQTLVTPSTSANPLRNTANSTQRRSGTLSDLCFNYANERLLELYEQSVFTNPLQLYKQQNIEVDLEAPAQSVQSMVDLIDKPSKQDLVHSANIQVRSQERRGLLWLLDEESMFPGATDQSFLERMFVHYGAIAPDKSVSASEQLVRKSQHYNHFIVRHALGTQPVTYDVKGWVRQAQESPVTRAVLPLLQDSNKEHVSTAYVQLRAGMIAGFAQGSSSTESTRRATAVLKALNNPHLLKRKTYCAMSKVQMDCVIETARRMERVHFVHCVQPYSTPISNDQSVPSELHVPTVRAQIRGLQLVHAVRFNKIGFPERFLFSEFTRRFACLCDETQTQSNTVGPGIKNYRQAAEQLMHDMGVQAGRFRLGVTLIFLRADLLCELEERRNIALSGVLVALQSLCRAHLAKKQLAKRQMQERAMQCIHKNIDKHMKVNEWPWWRLYVKVLPLISLTRTDDQLHDQAEELSRLRAKCKSQERECADWRLQCDKLQARLSDTTTELGEERAALTHATDALAQENAHKVRLSQQLVEAQSKKEVLERKAHKLELESMQYKNIRQAVFDHASDDPEQTGDVAERVLQLQQHIQTLSKHNQLLTDERDTQLTHQHKLTQQKLETVEQEKQDLSEQLSVTKRRAQKATDELQDVRLHLDKLTHRNRELEKKQKKFDSELNAAHAESAQCRQMRDKVMHEHEQTLAKHTLLQHALQNAESTLSEQKRERDQLQSHMTQLSASTEEGGTLHTELVALRRTKHELETKSAEQEAELDDMAGQVQQLEATVVRLQMQLQAQQKSMDKETESREHELEQLRTQSQRRVRAMEQQLEEGQEHRSQLHAQVRDLDIRLQEANQRDTVRDDSFEAQLKRDLRRTKALLKDAQSVLEKQRANAPNRGLLKQLKNQLEDAEAARVVAVKARQRVQVELDECRAQVDTAAVAKEAIEDRLMQAIQQKNTLAGRLETHDDEWQDVLRKYKAQVQQGCVDSITQAEQLETIANLEREQCKLKEQVHELQDRVQWQGVHMVDGHKLHLAELKIRDLEAKLQHELCVRAKMDLDAALHKDQQENSHQELLNEKAAHDRCTEQLRRAKEECAHAHEMLIDANKRHTDSALRARDMESALDRTESEQQTTMADLKLALRRIECLQTALRDQMELDDALSDIDEAEEDDIHRINNTASVDMSSERTMSPRADSVDQI